MSLRISAKAREEREDLKYVASSGFVSRQRAPSRPWSPLPPCRLHAGADVVGEASTGKGEPGCAFAERRGGAATEPPGCAGAEAEGRTWAVGHWCGGHGALGRRLKMTCVHSNCEIGANR